MYDESQKTIEIKTYLNKKDLKRFYNRAVFNKIIAYFCGGLISIIFLGLISFIIRRDFNDYILFCVFCSIFLSVFMIFYSMYSFSNARRLANKLYNTDPFISKEVKYIFSEKGIIASTENSYSEVEWKNVYKVIEQKELFAIYISAVSSYLILKNSFCSSNEIKKFTYILGEHIEKDKLKLKTAKAI
jgi:hypothetical protein